MKFSKEPYKIATGSKKNLLDLVMIDTVGMVLKGTGIAYRKQDQRGQYVIDHVPSGHYIAKVQGSEVLARRMCVELSKALDFSQGKGVLVNKENRLIVKNVTELVNNLKEKE